MHVQTVQYICVCQAIVVQLSGRGSGGKGFWLWSAALEVDQGGQPPPS